MTYKEIKYGDTVQKDKKKKPKKLEGATKKQREGKVKEQPKAITHETTPV